MIIINDYANYLTSKEKVLLKNEFELKDIDVLIPEYKNGVKASLDGLFFEIAGDIAKDYTVDGIKFLIKFSFCTIITWLSAKKFTKAFSILDKINLKFNWGNNECYVLIDLRKNNLNDIKQIYKKSQEVIVELPKDKESMQIYVISKFESEVEFLKLDEHVKKYGSWYE